MTDPTSASSDGELELLGRETAYQGVFRIERLRLRHRRHEGDWTEPYQREVFERGHAVAVLPYDPWADRVVLIEQLRAPCLLAGRPLRQLEVPAGIVEEGEAPEAVARRELREETGLECGELRLLFRFLPSPGGSSETIRLYLTLIESAGAGGHHGLAEEHEEIRVLALPAQEAFRLVAEGRVENATALLALQWLELHRVSLRSGAVAAALPPVTPAR